jgi:uncharacterized protein YcfJ
MKTSLSAILGVAAMVVTMQAAAQLTFYQDEGLRGRSFGVDRAIDNFDHYGFNDRASSVVVQHGEWEVCEDAAYRGRCIVLRPGQYPSLASVGMNNVISSARPVRGGPNYSYLPPPPVPAPYPYYAKPDEPLFEARVLSVRAVMGAPEQRCWVEREQVQRDSGANIGGAIIGGVLGGVLGHQIGGGRGNDVATAVGAVGGAAVGANVNRDRGGSYTQDVQRCTAVQGSGRPEYWDVTYTFRGTQHRTQLSAPPGATITVNGRGEPRL